MEILVKTHPVCYVGVREEKIFKALVSNGLADADMSSSMLVSREYFSEILDNLEENDESGEYLRHAAKIIATETKNKKFGDMVFYFAG